MSTIKSSDEHLTLNADGTSKDIKFQANGVEKASISSAGAFTSTTIDATKLTGDLPAISGANLTGVGVAGITSTADATAITIDSNERIGFPNAPHAWNTAHNSTAIRALQLGQHTGLVGFDGKSTSLATNAYLSAGQPYNGTWKYVDTYNAQMILADSGNYYFRSAASGTAGNTISWKYAMITNDNSGAPNVAFGGDANPDSDYVMRIFPHKDLSSNYGILSNSRAGETMYHMVMRRADNGNNLGLIHSNGSSTTYATSSDYRLKENVDYTWDATTRLKQLKPARFNWIADETDTVVDGFLAHEVESIVPEAVVGTKDAMETYTDENGDEQTRINPQSIDQSKLVPLLVKTIQELEARITALEA